MMLEMDGSKSGNLLWHGSGQMDFPVTPGKAMEHLALRPPVE